MKVPQGHACRPARIGGGDGGGLLFPAMGRLALPACGDKPTGVINGAATETRRAGLVGVDPARGFRPVGHPIYRGVPAGARRCIQQSIRWAECTGGRASMFGRINRRECPLRKSRGASKNLSCLGRLSGRKTTLIKSSGGVLSSKEDGSFCRCPQKWTHACPQKWTAPEAHTMAA